MLKIDRDRQSFTSLETPTLSASDITERYDLQEFISHSPQEFFREIDEDLFLVGKEVSPSDTVQDRIDLLALDKEGACVAIELKRGNHKLQMMQAISYVGMVSHWSSDDFDALLDGDRQEALTDFLECDKEDINRKQRIILIAEAYDYALLAGAEWLSEQFGVNIKCCRIAMATDPTTNSEYLSCSIVYPAPELAAEAKPRGRGVRASRAIKWTDWESALADVTNPAVIDFFNEQLAASRESYLLKRIVHYRIDGTRRWWVSARRKRAYVWQRGRFENDIEFWSRRVSESDSVEPVKRGRCVRMFLETKRDFETFHQAATKELLKVTWTTGEGEEDLDD